MEQKWDFTRQVTGQLECIVSSYEAFCDAAARQEQLDLHVWHDDYGDRNPFSIHLNMAEFPQDYMVIHNIADAYVQAVFTDTAFYRERYLCVHNARWKDCGRDFWNMSQAERIKYLMECRTLYEGITVIKKARFIIREWDCIASEMEMDTIFKTSPELVHFKNAKIIEIGECEGGFRAYAAISRNRFLLVTCGCWQ